MNFDIYVLGDVSSFVAALNSVVMVFGKTSFFSGAALLGAMLGLFGFLVYLFNKEAGAGVLMGAQPIVGLIAFFVFFSSLGIKTTVRINDTFTGNTNIVSNVPAIISMPASVITTAAYRVFDYTNTAFQSSNGSYMSTGQFGFVMPLQILQTMRNGVERTNPSITASLRQFIIDCAPGGAINVNSLGQASDTLENLLTYARDNGLTTFYDATPGSSPDGQAMSCFEAKQKIRTQVDGYLSGTFLNASLVDTVNTSIRQKNPTQKVTLGTIQDTVDNVVIKGLGTTTQTSQAFMKNVLLHNTIANTFSCLQKASDAAQLSECDIMMTQANEQWKTDAAAAGSLFAKTMIPAMVFLQLLFFTLAPIVIIYGLIRGPAGIGMYVKYLGFGVWTASWLPVSSAIQMYIQNNVMDRLAQMPANMVTLRAVQPYYDVISTNLGLASDMLAATPLVTATILGVSSMAMTQLATKMGGTDRVNERVAAPDLMAPAAVASASSPMKMDGATGLAIRGSAPMPSITLRGSESSRIASAQRQEQSDAAQAKVDVNDALTANQAHADSLIKKSGTSETFQKANGWRYENGMVVGTDSNAGTKVSSQEAARVVANAKANMDFSAQLKTQIASDLMKAPGVAAKLAEKGIGQDKLAGVVGESIAANAAKDAGFMKRLMAGDEGAIGTVVDTIGWTATGIGVLTSGPIGGGLGMAAKAAARPLMVGGAKMAINGARGLIARGGKIAENIGSAGALAAELFAPQAGISAGVGVAIATDKQLSKSSSDEQGLMMKVAESTTRADTTSQTRTSTTSSGNERSAQDSTTTTWASTKTFGVLATQAASRADSYERSAASDRSSSVDMQMTPATMATMLANDKNALAAFESRIRDNQRLVDQNWQAAEVKVDGAVQNFPDERVRRAVIGTFALADKEGNVFGNAPASPGMTPSTNEGVGNTRREQLTGVTGGEQAMTAATGIKPLEGTPGYVPPAGATAAPGATTPAPAQKPAAAGGPAAGPAKRPGAMPPVQTGVPGAGTAPAIDVASTLRGQGSRVGGTMSTLQAEQAGASKVMDRNVNLSADQVNSVGPFEQLGTLMKNDAAQGIAITTAATAGLTALGSVARNASNANTRDQLAEHERQKAAEKAAKTGGVAGGSAGGSAPQMGGSGQPGQPGGSGGGAAKPAAKQPALFKPKRR